MITLITGAPGAGKSCACVELLLTLSKDRPVYVHGIPDLTIPHVQLDEPHRWHEVVPDGAIVVIDEVQKVWRALRGKITPDIEALETHRHRGIDFFVMTQGPHLVHPNLKALVGRHVHLVDYGILGRKWFEWVECSDKCSTSTALVKKTYRLSKAAQQAYTSASIHIKPIRAIPRALVTLVGAAVLLVGAAVFVYFRVGDRVDKLKADQAMLKAGIIPGSAAASAAGNLEAADAAWAEAQRQRQAAALGLASASEPTPGAASPRSAPVLAGCARLAKRVSCYDTTGRLMDVASADSEALLGKAGAVLPLDQAVTLRRLAERNAPAGQGADGGAYPYAYHAPAPVPLLASRSAPTVASLGDTLQQLPRGDLTSAR